MSRIICDVCGTTYQDTAQCCPICGCTQDEAAGMMNDEVMMDELISDPRGKGGRKSMMKKREIFDFDEVNPGASDQIPAGMPSYDDDGGEEEPKQNTFAIVLLTALIALLLVGAGFLFIRFYLPGSTAKEEEPETHAALQQETEPSAVPSETTEPRIPCTSLALVSGMATGDNALVTPGQKFLINVIASPENTTDPICYTSGDESVATVSESGQVVAVGEGETVINISCGDVQIPCKIVCSFVQETEPVAAETEAPTEPPVVPGVVLKLKKSDVMLMVYYEFQLMLDCELEQNQVEWSSEHPHIAKVDEYGNVTALKAGTTSIVAKYGDQEVSCIVRCHN